MEESEEAEGARTGLPGINALRVQSSRLQRRFQVRPSTRIVTRFAAVKLSGQNLIRFFSVPTKRL